MPQKPVSKSSFGRLSVSLAVVAALLSLSVGLSPAQAQDSIREAKQRQAEIEAEREHATDGLAYLSAQELAVVKGREAATAVLEAEQAKINALQQALNATTFQLNQLEQNIAEFHQQLAALHATAAELAVQRYMHNGVDPVEVLFANANLSEGLALLALTETLFGDAADAIDQARVVEDDLNQATQRAQDMQAEITTLQADLEAGLPELEAKQAEWEDLEAQYNELRQKRQKEFDDLVAEDRKLQQFIQQKRAEEEIQRKLAALRESGGSGFVRPAVGQIVSYFGNRLHPILGYYRLHAGIDYDGNTGDPIIASRNGVVILAEYSGGYGHTVILDHGDGFSTLYAHLSAYNVSVGDTVAAGRTLGAMGSTGLSTGPHLHFEIRRNGTAVDPLPYLQ